MSNSRGRGGYPGAPPDMDHFQYRDDWLFAEDVSLRDVADAYATPCYVYSRATLEKHWRAFDEAFSGVPHQVCFAVKANGNLAVLDVLSRLGSGFDIVSVGELERVLAAGGDPARIIFSGVGKRPDEMRRAMTAGIAGFNVESGEELERLNEIGGELGVRAPASIRVNPDVDPNTHPYISTGLRENKFGIPIEQARDLYVRATQMPNLVVEGVDCHIGSQLTSLEPFVDALRRVLALVDELAGGGIRLSKLNVGGGLGIRYRDERPPEPREFARALLGVLDGRDVKLYVEPGRAIAGNAGILLTRVAYLKHNGIKSFAVVDAAMNDLIRPALYQGWHEIVPIHRTDDGSAAVCYDVVGPVCESADALGKERKLDIQSGDLLAIRTAGAYGFCMSSNYNARPRACEVMVDGKDAHLVRARETVEELFAGESTLPG